MQIIFMAAHKKVKIEKNKESLTDDSYFIACDVIYIMILLIYKILKIYLWFVSIVNVHNKAN